MKICILSDSHDHIPRLSMAVARAKSLGAEAVLHCGDVVAASSLRVLDQYQLPVHVIYGNNMGDLYMMSRRVNAEGSTTRFYGMDASIELGGRKIFLVHYPHYARALAMTGDYDLVCCGHTHEPEIQTIRNIKGQAAVIANPGTVGGVGKATPTWIMGDLATMQFELHEVETTEEAVEAL